MSCNTCVYLCFYDVMCAAVIKFTEESLQKLHLKSSGAKRVMRQKNSGFRWCLQAMYALSKYVHAK